MKISIYYNPETLDCYTIVFHKPLKDNRGIKNYYYISSSITGTGIYLHLVSETRIDKPTYKHLGKKVNFDSLAPELQKRIIEDYNDTYNNYNTEL